MPEQLRPYEGLAILTDLDGTLLMPDKTVSPEDAAAIADFRAKGGRFSIATGRGVQAAMPYLERFAPDFPSVLYNGAMVYDYAAHRISDTCRLPEGITEILRELTAKFPAVGAEVLREDGVFVLQMNDYERQHLEITHIPIVMRTLEDAEPEKCLKALFAGAPDDIAAMIDYVSGDRFPTVRFTRSHRWFLEILPKGVSKGSALTVLREHLPAGTIVAAAGDFDNDAAMLSAADFAACPADSQQSVLDTVRGNGFVSAKTCKNGFFTDFIHVFTKKYT